MMSKFGNVRKVTKIVGGKQCDFRSMLEFRWAVWLQLQKEQGLIKDWWYEPKRLKVVTKYFDNIKQYIPDFIIQNLDENFEIHETKGYFPQKDYGKLKLVADQCGLPITLIFANLTNCKSLRAQYGRAKELERYVKRIIYNADRDIFRKISYLFNN